MKLLVVFLVIIIVLVCSVPAYAGNGIRGDANQDGEISMGDVVMLERMILSYNPIIPEADINADGEVNMGDVIFTERVILGLSKVPEVEK
jgi:hypothetical protein